MRRTFIVLTLILVAAFGRESMAKDFGIKTNLLYDATLTVNLGAELQVAPKWSIDLSGNLNAWTLSHQRRWKHWLIQPEARYWFCEGLGGHFVAAHLVGGQYNFGKIGIDHDFLGNEVSMLRDKRYQGWFAGAGIGYGYSWLLGKHWNLEAEIAIGWAYTKYDRFGCAGCGKREGRGHHNYVGPTKAALSVVYVF